eukprot:TRINITY_DN15793_c1_g1_i2.p1 TRINITY_DN15793_c1_g1~~TRINITY_DN15793_c1_g1_i2.p1  ORF type:complete len:591 (+),score=68.73 TRINITY_DN15793_c1_g1_i2:72-1775(+)
MRGAAAGAALAASAAALLTAAYGGGPRPSSPPAAAGGAAEAQNGNSGGGREERSRAAGRAEPRNSSAGCTVTGPELCTRCGVGAAAWPLVTCTAAHCLLPPACPVQGASPLDCADTDRPDTAARSLFGSSALGDAGGEKSDAARCAELARSSGVLRIRSGDGPAAFATTFFEYLVNQLVFAERWNLSPWLDFDPRVATRVADPPPAPRNAWLAFLQPIGPYRPGLRCGGAPWDGTVVTLGYRYMHRFLHVSEQWAVRGWPYDGSPEWVSRYRADRLSAWDPEYYGAKRRLGARVVRDYFRWRPQVKARAAAAWAELFPRPAAVLGMHFRGTDKGNGRRQVTPSEFLPYAAGWARARGAAAGLLIASGCPVARAPEALQELSDQLFSLPEQCIRRRGSARLAAPSARHRPRPQRHALRHLGRHLPTPRAVQVAAGPGSAYRHHVARALRLFPLRSQHGSRGRVLPLSAPARGLGEPGVLPWQGPPHLGRSPRPLHPAPHRRPHHAPLPQRGQVLQALGGPGDGRAPPRRPLPRRTSRHQPPPVAPGGAAAVRLTRAGGGGGAPSHWQL